MLGRATCSEIAGTVRAAFDPAVYIFRPVLTEIRADHMPLAGIGKHPGGNAALVGTDLRNGGTGERTIAARTRYFASHVLAALVVHHDGV